MAVPDVEAVQAWQRAKGAVADGDRESGRIELCDLSLAIEHADRLEARQLLVDASPAARIFGDLWHRLRYSRRPGICRKDTTHRLASPN